MDKKSYYDKIILIILAFLGTISWGALYQTYGNITIFPLIVCVSAFLIYLKEYYE